MAAIGDIFFARLALNPRQDDYFSGLVLAPGSCLLLQIGAFILVSISPKWQKRA